MGQYKGLITLDLENNITSKQRTEFYKILEQEKWTKISNLTTAWKVRFDEDVDYQEAVDILKRDIDAAKQVSRIFSVRYAIHLGFKELEVF